MGRSLGKCQVLIRRMPECQVQSHRVVKARSALRCVNTDLGLRRRMMTGPCSHVDLVIHRVCCTLTRLSFEKVGGIGKEEGRA